MSLNISQKYINVAKDISMSLGKEPRRHVSFIFKGNKLISIGVNKRKTHPRADGYRFQGIHSELDALLKAKKRIDISQNKLTLINYRFNLRGELRTSKPCLRCIDWCRCIFNEIYYSNDDGIEVLEFDKNIVSNRNSRMILN